MYLCVSRNKTCINEYKKVKLGKLSSRENIVVRTHLTFSEVRKTK